MGKDRLLGGKGLKGLDFDASAGQPGEHAAERDLRTRGLDLVEDPRADEISEADRERSSR